MTKTAAAAVQVRGEDFLEITVRVTDHCLHDVHAVARRCGASGGLLKVVGGNGLLTVHRRWLELETQGRIQFID